MVEVLESNKVHIGKTLKGWKVRDVLATKNGGVGVLVTSECPILISTWRIRNDAAGAENITYKVLISREEDPDPDDAGAWEELVEDTAMAADATAVVGSDSDEQYTAILLIAAPAVDGTQSAGVRLNLLSSV